MFENTINLAIVDDHPIVIEGLKSVFKSHKKKYRLLSFTSGGAILSHITHSPVDVVLLDISLPDANGVDVCKLIKSMCPQTIVIGLSIQAERNLILQMLQNGASGFLLKDVSTAEILSSIEETINGGIALSAEVKKILATYASYAKVPSLTKREKQLLQLLANGKTTVEIAVELHLSRFTVDTYRKNLLRKFEAKNTAELLMLLAENNMM